MTILLDNKIYNFLEKITPIKSILLGSRVGEGSADGKFALTVRNAEAICEAKFEPGPGCRPALSCILDVAALLNLLAILFKEVTFGKPEFDLLPLLLPYLCRCCGFIPGPPT